MIGFNSQNLFKLPAERKYRNTIFKDNTGTEQNVCDELLQISEDDDMSECEPKTEQQHLWDFHRHKELSRPDAEVDNINDLHKLYAMREEDENRKKKEKELKAENR